MALNKVEITNLKTNDIKVLSTEEMNELFIKFKNGDKLAKEELINGNLKLVLSILRNFNNKNHNMDDLFQIGVIGLIKAIENFDISYGLKLSTYAVPLILGEIKRYIRDNSPVRISRSIKDLSYKIMKYKDEFVINNGFEPTNEEICKALNIEDYEISYALDSLKEPVSIFEPIYNDGGDTIYLLDQLCDKNELYKDKDMLISLRKALGKIKDKERSILINRFIIGRTQNEIASYLNISQAQVSRIEHNAINNIKRLIK